MNLEEIIRRYLRSYGRLRAETVARVAEAWRRFGGLDDEQAARFAAAAVPLVEGAQAATAALVAAYLATLGRAATGQAAPPLRAASSKMVGLRGIETVEVYQRPTRYARFLIGEGKPAAEALLLARRRAEILAETDVILTQRQATLEVVNTDDRIVGYRRVLTGQSCAFCAAASTQRYHREQLMPIHGRCDCGVAPIWGTVDPGQTINRGLVDDLKTAAREGRGGKGYWEQRHVTVAEDGTLTLPKVAVHRHGELGPVLGDATHKFTGQADLAA